MSLEEQREGFLLGERVTWVGIWAGVALTLFEIMAGFVGKSTAIIADATHSASDLFATVVVLLSLKVAKKPLDVEHPYGHGKIESLAAGVVGLLLMGTGVLIVISAARALLRGEIAEPQMMALVAAVAAIVVRESLYQYTARAGEKLNSPAITASAWHHRSDAYSSVAALIGVSGGMLGYRFLDPLAGIGVSVFIVKMGWGIIIDAYHGLMDTGPGERVLKSIVKVAESVSGVEHAYTRARKMGRFILADVKIDVDPKATVEEGHLIGHQVKQKILSDVEHVVDVMVHLNPHLD